MGDPFRADCINPPFPNVPLHSRGGIAERNRQQTLRVTRSKELANHAAQGQATKWTIRTPSPSSRLRTSSTSVDRL